MKSRKNVKSYYTIGFIVSDGHKTDAYETRVKLRPVNCLIEEQLSSARC